MTTAPVSHLNESLKLEGDSYIDLWEITLKGVSTIVRFWNGPTRTWQGVSWEGISCQLAGEAQGDQNQNVRPTLNVVNPSMVFGPFAAAGYFDLAVVVRKRLLQSHFTGNVNEFQQRVWIVGSIPAVSDQGLRLDLRSPTDTPAWKTPRRTYSPPEFPFIVL